MSLLSISNLGLFYGDKQIFSRVNLGITNRAKIGLVGSNGSGKTSLIMILAGALEPTEGEVYREKGCRVGYVPQTPPEATTRPLRAEIMTAFDDLFELESKAGEKNQLGEFLIASKPSKAEIRYLSMLQRYQGLEGIDYQSAVERTAFALGLNNQILDTRSDAVSGGERTKAALCKALLLNPDLLVLDEPTNYLDLRGLEWLERFLNRNSVGFIVSSHDRYFLDSTVTSIWEIEEGALNFFPGNYSVYRQLKNEYRQRYLKQYQKQQKEIAQKKDFIARYHAGQRSKEARSRSTQLKKMDILQSPTKEAKALGVKISKVTRSGHQVMVTKNLWVGYKEGYDAQKILEVPDLILERGSRTAVLGPNGSGKTSFVRTILGLNPALHGTILLGHKVKVGYLPQGLHHFSGKKTVLESFLEVKAIREEEARTFLSKFLFHGDQVYQAVEQCSGGEKSRLALARLLIDEPNFLVLDEPTSHLDVMSREALERILDGYEGTLLFISHDRQLVSLLARQLLVIENQNLTVFQGKFDEWVGRRKMVSSDTPRAKDLKARQGSRYKSKPKSRMVGDVKNHKVDLGQEIAELEDYLKKVGRDLQKASSIGDMVGVVRFGNRYNETEELLRQKLETWQD